MIVTRFHIEPETGHQNFMAFCLTDDGQLWACGADWNWFAVTPCLAEDDDDEQS